MTTGYRAVGWNANKRRYDLALLGGLLLYLAVFLGVGAVLRPNATAETLLLRASGSGALVLLHVVLSIGPLCRLWPRLLPLLYNRRHLGVATFCLALLHGSLALVQYHALGDANPFVSLLTAGGRWDDLARLPFQPFGAAALVVLFLMAATSHDFWLANLGAPAWKALHMSVYLAWASLVLHVAFGVVQDEIGAGGAVLLGAAVVWVGGLHLLAGVREVRKDRERLPSAEDAGSRAPPSREPPGRTPSDRTPCEGAAPQWLDAGPVDGIPEGRARVVVAGGERVAIFRWEGRLAATGNVCAHQAGPLGEGRVVDGCVTCPWHGHQFRPQDGRSPPPYEEAIATYRVRVAGGRILLDPRSAPPGTPQEPARCEVGATEETPFYIGYRPAPAALRRLMRRATAALWAGGAALAALLALGVGPFEAADFEYGVVRSFEGEIDEQPAPSLRAARPGRLDGREVPVVSRWLLVEPGKRGAASGVAGLDGRRVRLRGTLIHRGGSTMIELAEPPEVLEAAAAAPSLGEAVSLGEVSVVGQIVDSKCYFGVMVPADTRTHHACAVRCLSGGIPPVLRARLEGGGEACLLLVAEDGSALGDAVLPFVAEPLRVGGALERHDDLLVLRTDPSRFERLLDAR